MQVRRHREYSSAFRVHTKLSSAGSDIFKPYDQLFKCSLASYHWQVYSYHSHDDPISVQSSAAMNHSVVLRNTSQNKKTSIVTFFIKKK